MKDSGSETPIAMKLLFYTYKALNYCNKVYTLQQNFKSRIWEQIEILDQSVHLPINPC